MEVRSDLFNCEALLIRNSALCIYRFVFGSLPLLCYLQAQDQLQTESWSHSGAQSWIHVSHYLFMQAPIDILII